ncbi:hypothetical protein [Burkholderia sp. S171]|uniref:hypothetical protein n=1 Tax=Burkholderia sp. S171 TaxID=1641860 RepID=UPI00131C8C1E|nr:hypothetical protein [Burkholderia sp. S171]
MIIVCTTDQSIIQYAQSQGSGAALWGNVNVLAAANNLAATVAQLQPNEPLCLCAHGNNSEIGDDDAQGWGWTYDQIAAILAANVPAGFSTILIYACATNVANYSAALAVELENNQALNGLWCYGWNTPLAIGTAYPDPSNLANQVALQGSPVNFS